MTAHGWLRTDWGECAWTAPDLSRSQHAWPKPRPPHEFVDEWTRPFTRVDALMHADPATLSFGQALLAAVAYAICRAAFALLVVLALALLCVAIPELFFR